GLAHQDVGVGQLVVLARVVPGRGDLAGGAPGGALPGGLELWVAGVVLDQSARADGQRLHARGDHGARLAGADGVEGGAGGLDRGGAETGDGRAGNGVHAEAGGHHPGEVAALIALGETGTELQVVDGARIELGYLIEGRAHHLRCELVRADVLQRALAGAGERWAAPRTASGTWFSFDDGVRAGSGRRHARRPDPTVRDTTGCSYWWGSPTARALGRPPPIRTAPHSRSRRERLVAYSARSRI